MDHDRTIGPMQPKFFAYSRDHGLVGMTDNFQGAVGACLRTVYRRNIDFFIQPWLIEDGVATEPCGPMTVVESAP